MPDFFWSTFASHLLILVAGLSAGFVNAFAGGGTFFSYPAFVAGGVPPALASASNTVGLWPGNAMAALAYRRELFILRRHIAFLSVVTLTGSALGAGLLLWVGNAGFARLLPPLVLFATLLFAYAERVRHWVLRRARTCSEVGQGRVSNGWGAALGLGLVTTYGGFFGGGVSLMVMATLSLMGFQDLQQNNALKNWLATLIISGAFAVFLIQGSIAWPQTMACFAGSMAGGLLGARVARRLPIVWLRSVVVLVGLVLTAVYTWQYWIKPLI